MIRRATAMKLRQNLGELLNEVQHARRPVVITRGGKQVAALVDIELFDRIRAMRDEFRRMTEELGRAYEGVDPAVAQAEIDEAVAAARRRTRARLKRRK
ncbi:type II toxin-antitoxin system Phd/YefM family antitoxin [Vineibacter terrae]|uniref:Antitoxin n=1 Tax=Vineibacter terrae TaxID=2586908 RepID=A0A5C8PJ37_9HYPH|nr:type II toxin-antitoxin system Phd/YefM family antitoxin [Vineibacter terrae]TXL73541.1 type II toxin-antitoxin system Phd/YefM family antitoxin [Vineibacter terrae]